MLIDFLKNEEFTPSQVEAATGCTVRTQQTWFQRDLTPFPPAMPAAGHAKKYDLLSVYALAVMSTLVRNCRVSPAEASVMTRELFSTIDPKTLLDSRPGMRPDWLFGGHEDNENPWLFYSCNPYTPDSTPKPIPQQAVVKGFAELAEASANLNGAGFDFVHLTVLLARVNHHLSMFFRDHKFFMQDDKFNTGERAKATWDANEDIREEFGNDFGAYLAFRKAEESGNFRYYDSVAEMKADKK